jgi:hypothetical protein
MHLPGQPDVPGVRSHRKSAEKLTRAWAIFGSAFDPSLVSPPSAEQWNEAWKAFTTDVTITATFANRHSFGNRGDLFSRDPLPRATLVLAMSSSSSSTDGVA